MVALPIMIIIFLVEHICCSSIVMDLLFVIKLNVMLGLFYLVMLVILASIILLLKGRVTGQIALSASAFAVILILE
jgi:hypothetical protein